MSVLDPLFCIRCHRIIEENHRSDPCTAGGEPGTFTGSHAFEKTSDSPPSSGRGITFFARNGEKFRLDEETSRAAREVAAHRGITIDDFVREVYRSTRNEIN